MVGHGTVRIDAMGFENRPPTEAELARMKATVGEAMEAGAFGFSVGLAYAPGDYARTDEVIELAKVSAAHGGMFGTHMRDYSDRIFESLEETFDVGRQAGLPVVISHIGVQGEANVGKIGEVLAAIEGAREEGLEVATDVYPLAAGTDAPPAAAALGERRESRGALPASAGPRSAKPNEGGDGRGDGADRRRYRGQPLGRDTPCTGAE